MNFIMLLIVTFLQVCAVLNVKCVTYVVLFTDSLASYVWQVGGHFAS